MLTLWLLLLAWVTKSFVSYSRLLCSASIRNTVAGWLGSLQAGWISDPSQSLILTLPKQFNPVPQSELRVLLKMALGDIRVAYIAHHTWHLPKLPRETFISSTLVLKAPLKQSAASSPDRRFPFPPPFSLPDTHPTPRSFYSASLAQAEKSGTGFALLCQSSHPTPISQHHK